MRPNAHKGARRLVLCALLVAVGFVLGYLEQLVPLPLPVPGLKLGLANVVTLFAVYRLRTREAVLVVSARCLLGSLLFGGPMQLAFSLGGGLLALAAMEGASRLPAVTALGTGIAGAAAHALGQVLVAMVWLATPSLFFYLLVLWPASLLTGTAVAVVYALFDASLGRMWPSSGPV